MELNSAQVRYLVNLIKDSKVSLTNADIASALGVKKYQITDWATGRSQINEMMANSLLQLAVKTHGMTPVAILELITNITPETEQLKDIKTEDLIREIVKRGGKVVFE